MSKFFKRLISYSKEMRPVTGKKDRAIWVIFLRNAYHVGKTALFRLPFIIDELIFFKFFFSKAAVICHQCCVLRHSA